MSIKSLFRKIKESTKKLKKEIITLYIAFKKKETPIYAKIFAIIVVSYALSPIDLIPDFIPVLGYLDDLILLPLGIKIAVKMIPNDIIIESRKEAENIVLKDLIGAKIATVSIVILWILLIIYFTNKLFF